MFILSVISAVIGGVAIAMRMAVPTYVAFTIGSTPEYEHMQTSTHAQIQAPTKQRYYCSQHCLHSNSLIITSTK